MTAPATEALAPPAITSNRGQGLALPVAKTLAHLMTVHNAIARETWPITAAQARTEIQEAVSHLDTLSLNHNLFTEELQTEIHEWIRNVNHHYLSFIVNDPEAAPSEDQASDLTSLIRLTWSLLSLIDREITGLPHFMADPGSQP